MKEIEIFNTDSLFRPKINVDYKNFMIMESKNDLKHILAVRDCGGNIYPTASIGDFVNGIATIKLANGKYMLINYKGEVSKEFDYIGKFTNGFAITRVDGIEKFIDYRFELLNHEFLFSSLSFQNGLIEVVDENGRCLLDKYLSLFKDKKEVLEDLHKTYYNYKNIPTAYFENKVVIKEFLQVCKNIFLEKSKEMNEATLNTKLVQFKTIVNAKNAQEKQNIKRRRQRDKEYQNFITDFIKNIEEFSKTNLNEKINECFDKIEF